MEFLLLIIAHLLGDFIFQSSKMAGRKRVSLKCFVLHSLLYSGFIILALIWFGPLRNVIYAALIIIVSHVLIDYIRNVTLKILSAKQGDHKTSDFIIFIADQILHILIIIFCIHLLKETNSFGKFILNGLLTHIPWKQLHNGSILALLYILCLSPAAIFIKRVFVLFSFQNDDEIKTKDDLIKSGYLIGILERIIILTLGLNGQLGAIGFVLAAKSLARFNQLNDKSFAEKYLVGTLLSAYSGSSGRLFRKYPDRHSGNIRTLNRKYPDTLSSDFILSESVILFNTFHKYLDSGSDFLAVG